MRNVGCSTPSVLSTLEKPCRLNRTRYCKGFIAKASDALQEKIALPKWIEVPPADRPRMLQVLRSWRENAPGLNETDYYVKKHTVSMTTEADMGVKMDFKLPRYGQPDSLVSSGRNLTAIPPLFSWQQTKKYYGKTSLSWLTIGSNIATKES
jgi:hypothetical protein